MHELIAILLCVLAVLGLHALFSRVAVMLLPRGEVLLSVDGRGRTLDDILFLTERARLIIEREGALSLRVLVLLEENEQEKVMSLREEGILVYIVSP